MDTIIRFYRAAARVGVTKPALGSAMPACRDGRNDIKNQTVRFANRVAIFASESANIVAIRATLAKIGI